VEFPFIQGQAVSYAEIEIALAISGGVRFRTKDFAAIDWDDALEPGKVRGTGPEIISRTTGEYDANGSMTMYYAKSVEFQRALKARKPQVGIGLVVFDIVINWSPLDGEGEVFTAKLIGCRLAGRQVQSATGPDPTQKVMPLSVTRIEENGICLI
jgi:hypothetical protein